MFSDASWYREDIDYIADFTIDWHKLKNSNILITGATGLIGTVLIDALMYKSNKENLGIKVFAFARDKERINQHFSNYRDNIFFEAVQGDVSKSIELHERVDFVINLASNTHPALYATEPIKTIDSIVSGVKNILEYAVDCGVKRVVNASSVEIYGENRGDVERFTEDYCGYINCNTLRAGYPEGKRLAEALCQAYISEKNLDVVSARLGRVYGAPSLQSDTKSTTQFIRSAVKADDIILKSEGKQRYSYVYIADAITALLLLLTEGKKGESYNVAHDEIKTFREVAEILANINKKKIIFDMPSETDRAGFSVVQSALLDSSKIKGISWRAGYDLKSGLVRSVMILKSRSNE